jgi:hypothetical protein
MKAVSGIFRRRDLTTLLRMRTEWDACLSAVAIGHQSYSIAGRSFTRANLSEIVALIGEIDDAIAYKSGTLVNTVYVDMSGT